MRISVNLATRPFVELRPFFVRLRLVMVLLAVAGVAAMITSHLLQNRLDHATAQMDQLHNQMLAAQQEKLHNEQRMRQPVNAAVLDRAHFLNTLFLIKSFSWTAVMMDLETVLPTGVQVTSIEPQISADGQVVIRLRVSGERDRAVQLVRNLERSRRFLAPQLMGESVQANGANGQVTGAGAAGAAANVLPGGVEFEIQADYNPLPAGQPFARPGHAQQSSLPADPAGARYGVVLKPYAAAGAGKPLYRNGTPPIEQGSPAVPGSTANRSGGHR